MPALALSYHRVLEGPNSSAQHQISTSRQAPALCLPAVTSNNRICEQQMAILDGAFTAYIYWL